MLNEMIFLGHALLVVAFVLSALRFGQRTLTATLALLAILANLFVLKQTHLFGLNVICSDVYVIGSMLGLNLLQEYYGKRAARGAVWISFFALLLFGLMSQIHLLYKASTYDTRDLAYHAILSPTPRLLFASFAAYLLSQLLDTELFGRLRRGPLFLRSAFSMTLCQVVDTATFTLLGLLGLVSHLLPIVLMSLAIKMITICTSTPFLALARRLVPRDPQI
jgi:queuosine precursor transporter